MATQPRFTRHLPAALALATLSVLMMFTPALGLAQTFTVLHAFTGGPDGANPLTTVTVGGPGVLYGTTYYGGTQNNGAVFKLEKRGATWTLSPLFGFPHGCDGLLPAGPVVVGPNGALYGTTEFGGCGSGTGTVFELQPPATVCKAFICYWTETVVHAFNGSDGGWPINVQLVFDRAGNMYGTTQSGGAFDRCEAGEGYDPCGVVFELTPSGQSWTETVLHSFDDNGTDGWYPLVGVTLDSAGNLYGSTWQGGTSGGGTVFELSPSGGTWTESILANFGYGTYLGSPAAPGTLLIDRPETSLAPRKTADSTVQFSS